MTSGLLKSILDGARPPYYWEEIRDYALDLDADPKVIKKLMEGADIYKNGLAQIYCENPNADIAFLEELLHDNSIEPISLACAYACNIEPNKDLVKKIWLKRSGNISAQNATPIILFFNMLAIQWLTNLFLKSLLNAKQS